MLKEVEGQYPVLMHFSLKIVVFSKTQYLQVSWYFGVIGVFNFVGLISNYCWCF